MYSILLNCYGYHNDGLDIKFGLTGTKKLLHCFTKRQLVKKANAIIQKEIEMASNVTNDIDLAQIVFLRDITKNDVNFDPLLNISIESSIYSLCRTVNGVDKILNTLSIEFVRGGLRAKINNTILKICNFFHN